MYTLALQRSFTARHFLTGGDWGPENEVHAHPYRAEIRLRARNLDEHGYIVDLEKLEACLDGCVARYRDQVLNDLPEFKGINPSIEHFSRVFFERLAQSLEVGDVDHVEIRIWENDSAWASYGEPR